MCKIGVHYKANIYFMWLNMPSIILYENSKETKNKLNAIDRLQRNKFSQVALYMYACYCLNILCQPYHVQGTLNYFLCAFEKLKCKTSHF